MITRGIYQLGTFLASPIIALLLKQRLAKGKEDAGRSAERRGIASLARPDGPLIWIHAASNGEAMSALPLIDHLLARDAKGHVLMTTGTVTSAKLMASRLPARAFHQFVPVDRPVWVRAFLNHWQPDAGIWIESEFWPALIWMMRNSGKPMALVNGRISARSLKRWQRFPGLAANLLTGFEPCLAQTEQEAQRLRQLGCVNADCVGNLKLSATPLTVDPARLTAVQQQVGSRPLWLAASTHPGEDAIIAKAHQHLLAGFPNLLTIIVPRHPDRGGAIVEQLQGLGLSTACRSTNQPITAETSVYVADTLGELGLFFRLASVAFIGGSLTGGHGGHNPLEAARLGCAPVHGPDMANFRSVAEDLAREGGAITVTDDRHLASIIGHLLTDDEARGRVIAAAERIAVQDAEIVERVMDRLRPILPPATEGEA